MTPKRFRTRPVEFEAVQYDGTNGQEIAAWVDAGPGQGFVHVTRNPAGEPVIAVYSSPTDYRPVFAGGWVFLYANGSVAAFAGTDPATLYDPVEA